MELLKKKFPEEYLYLPSNAEIGVFLVTRKSDGKSFKVDLNRMSDELALSSLASKPIISIYPNLPITNNDGEALIKGDWTILSSGVWDGLSVNPIEVPESNIGISFYSGIEWGEPNLIPIAVGVDVIDITGDRLPKEKAVANLLMPVISFGTSLAFTLKSGEIREDGSIAPSLNWLHAESQAQELTQYSIEGFGISSGSSGTVLAQRRVNFYNDNTYLGRVSSVGFPSKFTFTTIANTNNIKVFIEGATNAGANLPTSPFLESYKLYIGSEASDTYLKAEKIKGEIKTDQILQLETGVKLSTLSARRAPLYQEGIEGQNFIDLSSGLVYTKKNGSWGNGKVIGGQKRKFIYPEGFTWRPFDIFQSTANGVFMPAVTDITAHVLDSIKLMEPYYVDPVKGLAANKGKSPNNAFKTVANALSAGASLIYLMEGNYGRTEGIESSIITRNMAFVAYKGASVNMSFWDPANNSSLTWVQDGNVWTATRGGLANVIDTTKTDVNGNFYYYQKVETIDLCKATPGTYCYIGASLTVHTLTSTKPDFAIKINLVGEVCKLTLGANIDFIYVEGIKSYGVHGAGGGMNFQNNATTQYNGTVYVKNCLSIFNQLGDGIKFNNLKAAFVQDCFASKCKRDALNYHTSNTSFAKMLQVEINGGSLDTGFDSPEQSSSNGSTAHDGMSIIRFGGVFGISRGSTIVDVNFGIRSLNFNTIGYGSYLSTTASFHCQDGLMWLYGVYAYDSTFSARADFTPGNTSTIYYDVKSMLDGPTFGNVIQI